MNRVKLGVIGCGAIAQVHHMPNLFELKELFDVTAVCDVSVGAAHYVADRFHVPGCYTDYRDLLAADVDAVLLCPSDPKTQVAIDAFDAGKHAFVEKPVCFSLQEMAAMTDACARSGKVGQSGYMKIFDPGYGVRAARDRNHGEYSICAGEPSSPPQRPARASVRCAQL